MPCLFAVTVRSWSWSPAACSLVSRPFSSGATGFSVSVLPLCTHSHLQRQVPTVSTPPLWLEQTNLKHWFIKIFFSHGMQKPCDQMGLRGYKASTGINCTFCTTDFTRFTYLLLTSQVLGSLFYAYYVFVRLCIPQFRTISVQIMDLRANVLCIFNSILPGQMVFFCLSTLHLTQLASALQSWFTFVKPVFLCRRVGSLFGILCLSSLLAECFRRDASLCRQDVL